MHPNRPPKAFQLACRRHGVLPSRYVLVVSVATQTAFLYERIGRPPSRSAGRDPFPYVLDLASPAGDGGARPRRPAGAQAAVHSDYEPVRRFRCSTSRFGVGQLRNSNCTPLGLHRIAEKIGGGWPVGTVFRSRKVVGFTWQGRPDAPIAHRILWLDGLEPGFNRGGRVDTHRRYIYIHGLGDEPTLGRPASCGCVHLAAADLLPLAERLPVGTLVWISLR